MNCPRDAESLGPKSFDQTTVATCPLCGGMFLQHGQLNKIAGSTSGDLEFSSVELDSLQHEDEYGPIACPHDGTPMGKVDFVESTIILDYCTSCRGFWMDGKELARIHEEVQRLNEAERDVPGPLLVRISQFFWNLPLPR